MSKVFLGNFVYAEFSKVGVRLTDEDGCGRALDRIDLDRDQILKLQKAIKEDIKHG